MARSRGAATDLRIAHLIESDGPGGAERIVGRLASALQAAGTRNVVFMRRNGEGWLAHELAGSGVTFDYFHIDRPFSPACARELAQAFRRHRIDVAHSHEFSMAVYGAWASRRAGAAHVITMHGGRYYRERLRRRMALRTAMALSDCTVAVSESVAGALSRDLWMPRAHIVTVPNGVAHPVPEHVELRRELGLAPDDRLIVAVGNLYPVKGHRFLIEAVGLLSAAHPRLHVAIAGRGDLHDTLATLAHGLGIDRRVHLLGLRDDVPAVLAAADVFVLPSLSEGLPLAILEAMFAARPIVATDVGEVSAALACGEAGVLVPPGNAAALAAAIDGLLCDPDRAAQLGQRAAARAAAEYDLSRMYERYLDIYETVTRHRRSGWADVAAAHARPTL